MALTFETNTPAQLLAKFIKAVTAPHGTNGGITTWIKSETGNFFTHAAQEWKGKAWFKPAIKSNGLVFNILPSKGQKVSVLAYGYYHGHLMETVLNHFDQDFVVATASALPKSPDEVA